MLPSPITARGSYVAGPSFANALKLFPTERLLFGSHAPLFYPRAKVAKTESNGADIAALACRHPDARIIMAHMTGIGRRGVQDVEELPNVYVDTSGGWYDSEMVEYAVRHMGAERVLFGSDYPGRDYAPQIGRVLGTNLSEKDKEKVLWRNAVSVLKLDGCQG